MLSFCADAGALDAFAEGNVGNLSGAELRERGKNVFDIAQHKGVCVLKCRRRPFESVVARECMADKKRAVEFAAGAHLVKGSRRIRSFHDH